MSDQTSIATKINELLERVANVRRGSDLDRPTRFDREGEHHARQIAQRDQENN